MSLDSTQTPFWAHVGANKDHFLVYFLVRDFSADKKISKLHIAKFVFGSGKVTGLSRHRFYF